MNTAMGHLSPQVAALQSEGALGLNLGVFFEYCGTSTRPVYLGHGSFSCKHSTTFYSVSDSTIPETH